MDCLLQEQQRREIQWLGIGQQSGQYCRNIGNNKMDEEEEKGWGDGGGRSSVGERDKGGGTDVDTDTETIGKVERSKEWVVDETQRTR